MQRTSMPSPNTTNPYALFETSLGPSTVTKLNNASDRHYSTVAVDLRVRMEGICD